MPVDKNILRDYVATANSGKYSSLEEVNSKFPELKGYDTKVLRDYLATANSGKYSTLDEVNAKFPEFFQDGNKPSPPPKKETPPVKGVTGGQVWPGSLAGSPESQSKSLTPTGPSGSIGNPESVSAFYSPQDFQLLKKNDPVARRDVYQRSLAKYQQRFAENVQLLKQSKLPVSKPEDIERLKQQLAYDSKAAAKLVKLIEGQDILIKQMADNASTAMGRGLDKGIPKLAMSIDWANKAMLTVASNLIDEKPVNFLSPEADKAISFSQNPLLKGANQLSAVAKPYLEIAMKEQAAVDMFKKYEGSAIKALESGDIGAAASNVATMFGESFFDSMAALAPGLNVMSIAGNMGQSLQQVSDEGGQMTNRLILGETAKASMDMIMEKTFGLGSQLTKAMSKLSKADAEKLVRKTVTDFFKSWGKVAGAETAEEIVTQVASNAVDKYVLNKKDVGLFDGAGDAGLAGTFGALTQGGVVETGITIINNKRYDNYQKMIAERNDYIERAAETDNPTIAEVLNNKADEISERIQKEVDDDKKLKNKLEANEITELRGINQQIEDIRKSIPEADPETAKLLNDRLLELDKKSDSIINEAMQRGVDIRVAEFQERTKQDPPSRPISNNTFMTLERIDAGLPVDPVAAKEAADELFAAYKAYEAMLTDENRKMTREQIKTVLSNLEPDISNLQDIANGNEINTKTSTEVRQEPVEDTKGGAPKGDTGTEASRPYSDTVFVSDVSAESAQEVLESESVKPMLEAAVREKVGFREVMSDLLKSGLMDDLDAAGVRQVEAAVKKQLTPKANPKLATFVDNNYRKIVSDLKLKNIIKTKGCDY